MVGYLADIKKNLYFDNQIIVIIYQKTYVDNIKTEKYIVVWDITTFMYVYIQTLLLILYYYYYHVYFIKLFCVYIMCLIFKLFNKKVFFGLKNVWKECPWDQGLQRRG